MYTCLSFCAVKTGLPNELDLNEPERVAESVELMNLKHVVITAVAMIYVMQVQMCMLKQ